MSDLQGKIALVTGATRGIGKGIAVALGEAGATVYVTGRTLESSDENSGSLNQTKSAVEAAGGKCIPVQVDHSNDEQVRLLFERIDDEQTGKLDLLVNNAFSGVSIISQTQGKPFWDCDLEVWDRINNVGLRSHYIASVFAARIMKKRKQGSIFTISSWGGLSYIFGVAYGVGKSACDRLAADMAVELKPDNIASVSIWPGIVGTETFLKIAEDIPEENQADRIAQMFVNQYNWETPLLAGRAIAALAQEPEIIKMSGKVAIVAEVAKKYDLVDRDGNLPASLRSLRFLLPFGVPALQKYANLIPDIYIPWSFLLLTKLGSPKILV